MLKAKFLQILRTLDKEEFKKFGKFLHSPVFNTNKTIIHLYEVIKPCYPDFNNVGLKKENIFKKLYPDEIFKEKKIRNTSSEMLELTEKYLSFINISSDNSTTQIFLLKEIVKRDFGYFIDHYTKDISEIHNNQTIKDDNYYYNSYIKLNIINTYYKSKITNRKIGKIQDEIYGLNCFIVLASLKEYIYALDDSKINSMDYNYSMLPEIYRLSQSVTLPVEIKPILEILLTSIELRIEPSDEVFKKLKSIKNKYYRIIPKEYLKIIYISLYNYLIEKEDSNKKYTIELYAISNEVLKSKEILDNNKLTDSFFGNYVSTCLQLNYFQKAQQFIINYGPKLQKNVQNEVINLNLIRLYFYQKKYHECLLQIEKFRTRHWYYSALSKNYKLMSCFELKYFDQINYIIDSYNHFLKNNTIPNE